MENPLNSNNFDMPFVFDHSQMNVLNKMKEISDRNVSPYAFNSNDDFVQPVSFLQKLDQQSQQNQTMNQIKPFELGYLVSPTYEDGDIFERMRQDLRKQEENQRDQYLRLKYQTDLEQDPVKRLRMLDSGYRDPKPSQFSFEDLPESFDYHQIDSKIQNLESRVLNHQDQNIHEVKNLDNQIEKFIHATRLEEDWNQNIKSSFLSDNQRRRQQSSLLKSRRDKEQTLMQTQKIEAKKIAEKKFLIGNDSDKIQLEEKFQKLRKFSDEVISQKFYKLSSNLTRNIDSESERSEYFCKRGSSLINAYESFKLGQNNLNSLSFLSQRRHNFQTINNDLSISIPINPESSQRNKTKHKFSRSILQGRSLMNQSPMNMRKSQLQIIVDRVNINSKRNIEREMENVKLKESILPSLNVSSRNQTYQDQQVGAFTFNFATMTNKPTKSQQVNKLQEQRFKNVNDWSKSQVYSILNTNNYSQNSTQPDTFTSNRVKFDKSKILDLRCQPTNKFHLREEHEAEQYLLNPKLKQ
eukprot:403349749